MSVTGILRGEELLEMLIVGVSLAADRFNRASSVEPSPLLHRVTH